MHTALHDNDSRPAPFRCDRIAAAMASASSVDVNACHSQRACTVCNEGMQQTAPCRARLVHPILPRANDVAACRLPPPDCAACRKGTRDSSSIAIMMQAIIRCLRIRKPKPPRRQSLDDWHRTADAFKNLRATAAAATMRISHKPKVSRGRFRNARFHHPRDRENKFLNGPLDT